MQEGLIALQSKIIHDAKVFRAYDQCKEPLIPRMQEAGKIDVAIALDDYIDYLGEPLKQQKNPPATQNNDPKNWGDFMPEEAKLFDFNKPPTV